MGSLNKRQHREEIVAESRSGNLRFSKKRVFIPVKMTQKRGELGYVGKSRVICRREVLELVGK